MGSKEDQVLRTAKEIIVKFIETGRVYPTDFRESFKNVYNTINETIGNTAPQTPETEKKKN